ncbi:MAG: hypothetical protein PHR14_08525 [Oscillospiraceae bacterium]|nr:hypothetical protein [Oscillospiraceae bacterium]
MHTNATREEHAKLFLPEKQEQLEKLSFEELNEITKILFGCDVIEKESCVYKGNHSDDCCRHSKYSEIFGTYYKYANIFDFCKVLGVNNLYDIGCCFINQSFLLLDSPDVFYTGIRGFSLMDYHNVIDETYPNYHYPVAEQVPSFCDGRINFINKEYPFEITPAKNNIAIAIHSLGTYKMGLNTGPEIETIAHALAKDFDLILMDIHPESFESPYGHLSLWQQLIPEFEFYKIRSNFSRSLLFATKTPDDDSAKLTKVDYLAADVQPRGFFPPTNIAYDFNIMTRYKWTAPPFGIYDCEECKIF